ncbi:helix-turn-helix transcriptional regulator [Caulobacter radicis]|uniref:helix-turn-helix transcriptional regulator n=1 Tax=Caulobacter radicis TaxID=2172650 RepID=UPI000E2FFCC4|nr:helix-turn-helix domain-containing protein [Caulobacter radicis]
MVGDGWRIAHAERGLSFWHEVACGPFEVALRGGGMGDGGSLSVHVIFVVRGGIDVLQWGRARSLSAGDVYVSCGWLPLALKVDEHLEALICELPAWWAIRRFLDATLVSPDLFVDHDFFAAPVIQTMARAVFDLASTQEATPGLEMLAGLLRSGLAAHVDLSRPMPRVVGRMGRILQFMIAKIDQPGLSAHDAAAELKCSPRTIYKTCSDGGTTFNAMLMDVRLLTAQHQLLRGSDPISQVAYAVGFVSLSHFSRQFKERFGVTASAYRQARRQSG